MISKGDWFGFGQFEGSRTGSWSAMNVEASEAPWAAHSEVMTSDRAMVSRATVCRWDM